jgi:hypothetical protein
VAWIKTQKRLAQCYIATAAALNDCGILPDGAEIKQWIRDELAQVDPPVTPVEVDTVLMGMWAEGVKFHGTTPEALAKFAEHELFGKRGHKMGAPKT